MITELKRSIFPIGLALNLFRMAFQLVIKSLPKNLAVAFVIILATVPKVCAESEEGFQEYQVKAAFLYNFPKFVEWPQAALGKTGSPLVIGILGDDPFGSDLDNAVWGKTVQERTLMVKRMTSVDQIKGCHVLFICASEEKRLSAELMKAEELHILTVSEIEEFSRRGGMVTLITEGNKVRFEINVDAAQEAGLKISSQLLKLATIVRKDQ